MKYNFVCSHFPKNMHGSNVCMAVLRECNDNVEVCREALKITRYVSKELGHSFDELATIVFTHGEIEEVAYFGQAEIKFVREGLYKTTLYNEFNEIEEFVEYHEAIN
jgi:hypothetical protein